MGNEKYLVVVVGPTAVGKTDVCIKLAKKFNSEIISSDSRQFYREMEIGTAKPSKDELKAVKHHFINSHSIAEEVNAGSFEREAIALLDALFKNKDLLIMTGGSGLYINAVTEGMSDIPATDQSIRDALNEELDSKGLDILLQELEDKDPEYYQIVDKKNPHRIIRALEICRSTGKKYSDFRTGNKTDRPFEVLKIGLERPRDELYDRINHRMDEMIGDGLFEEAEKLYSYRNHQALQTVGYKEIFDYLDGVYDKDEAIRLLKRNSRRYAKRQMTWFKRDGEINWFEPGKVDELITYVCERIK